MASNSGSQFNFTLPIEALSGQNANGLSVVLGMQQQGEEMQSMAKVSFTDSLSYSLRMGVIEVYNTLQTV